MGGNNDQSKSIYIFCYTGYKLGKKTQGNIVKKYCDRKNHLSLDDFVLVTQKMTNSKGIGAHIYDIATFEFDFRIFAPFCVV